MHQHASIVCGCVCARAAGVAEWSLVGGFVRGCMREHVHGEGHINLNAPRAPLLLSGHWQQNRRGPHERLHRQRRLLPRSPAASVVLPPRSRPWPRSRRCRARVASVLRAASALAPPPRAHRRPVRATALLACCPARLHLRFPRRRRAHACRPACLPPRSRLPPGSLAAPLAPAARLACRPARARRSARLPLCSLAAPLTCRSLAAPLTCRSGCAAAALPRSRYHPARAAAACGPPPFSCCRPARLPPARLFHRPARAAARSRPPAVRLACRPARARRIPRQQPQPGFNSLTSRVPRRHLPARTTTTAGADNTPTPIPDCRFLRSSEEPAPTHLHIITT